MLPDVRRESVYPLSMLLTTQMFRNYLLTSAKLHRGASEEVIHLFDGRKHLYDKPAGTQRCDNVVLIILRLAL